ncbi:MAG: nucleotidyltransferase [Oscillospiraceae bacterium]|nr:nucleotidyltransferase [Oscillospiraceae bacterium]
MSNLTLVVLAAGMGTRFGTRIKQLEKLGPSGELLMDYSVYDAIKAGFDRVVFIIRRDIEELFKETIGDRISRQIRTEYVYQSPNILPVRVGEFLSRERPWGTAQALYCCKDVLDGPFGIINADDFYGQRSFKLLADFLKNPDANGCSVDFPLKNTLSDNGTVNRGICKTDASGLLKSVEETKGIARGEDGIIRGTYCGETKTLLENDTVSMSMWGFGADFMPVLEKRLAAFLESLPAGETKAELTIADAVGAEIIQNGFTMRDIPTKDMWFGITYESDVQQARADLERYTAQGLYPAPIWK